MEVGRRRGAADLESPQSHLVVEFSAERAASAECSATAWREIVLAPVERRTELHCSAHAATSGWKLQSGVLYF